MNPDLFLSALGEWFEDRGYTNVRCALALSYNGISDSVTVHYTDLLDERHHKYYRRADDESLPDWFDRINQEAAEIPFASDALRADAAAMVNRVRGKLIEAGFDREVWMAELDAIVADLSGNALAFAPLDDEIPF